MDTSNKKVREIIQAAERLFYRYGLKKVTVEEICQEGGVSKMTFYKHFRNKDDLILKMMKALMNESLEKYGSIMKKEVPYPEKVAEMIRMKLEYANQMSSDFIREYLEIANPEILAYLQEQTMSSIGLLMNDFRKAADEGSLRKDIKPEFIIYFINHLSEMLKDPRLMSLYGEPAEAISEVMNFFFYGILSREKK
ncbi:MAG: TetR/AcrR family transcriptional regulator [Bacteroidota bacterium]